ncbi:MlaA family lipoprotein [Nioella aestuarii]
MTAAAAKSRFRVALSALPLLALMACGPAVLPGASEINDPTEDSNRAMFGLNVAVDRALVRPVAIGYGTVVPEPVRDGISNASSNLNQPLYVVNNILQLRLDDALRNTFRFLMNSTFGLGGLLDPAAEAGLYAEETDFGETLHIWGASEGAYVVLPLLGPSTSRDTAGFIVDTVMNPTRLAFAAPESDYISGANAANTLNTRYELRDEIDRLYFESADGYAQARLIYLQNRRYELRGDQPTDYADPYADPYSDPYADSYLDPYEDPYAQ